jgi:3-isopropylmalate/(R)-2-methylmalate dehydratase small subunit
VLGDDVDTDLLALGRYMKGPIATLAQHCLEAVLPHFSREVRPGDILVAGRNFGIGSSREQAAEALKHLGIAAVIARSFGGIFQRNAINLGLPVLVCPDSHKIFDGDRLAIELREGVVTNATRNSESRCEQLPDFLLALLDDGGLIPHLKKQFQRN